MRWWANPAPGKPPARILLGFERADAGQVIIDGIDAGHLSREAQRQLRRKIQFVYQNPFASLDPRQTLFAIIEEPLKTLSASARRRVASVWRALPPGWPRPRAAVAYAAGAFRRPAAAGGDCPGADPRAGDTGPDEATSALDVTVQAQILALLQQLQQQLGLSYLFITHDLATVRRIADSVTVLRAGGGGAWRRKPPVRRPAAGLHPRTDRRHSPGFLPLSTGPHGERIMPKRLGFYPSARSGLRANALPAGGRTDPPRGAFGLRQRMDCPAPFS